MAEIGRGVILGRGVRLQPIADIRPSVTEWRMAMVRLYDGEIDEIYLNENVGEASGLDWQLVPSPDKADHFHCIICIRAVPWDCENAYRAGARYLCGDCYDRFIATS